MPEMGRFFSGAAFLRKPLLLLAGDDGSTAPLVLRLLMIVRGVAEHPRARQKSLSAPGIQRRTVSG